MVRLAATSPIALVFAGVTFLSSGCFDTSSSITTTDYPTLLTIDPLLFRGSLTCGAPGLVRYVVTLSDVTGTAPVVLDMNSTAPTICQNPVSFADSIVTSLHLYTAKIDGYNRDDIGPAVAGSADMYDPSMNLVPPTWTTSCGDPIPEEPIDAALDAVSDVTYNPLRIPTQVLATAEVFMHGCAPLVVAQSPDAAVDDGSTPPGDDAGDAGFPADTSSEAGDAADPDGGTAR